MGYRSQVGIAMLNSEVESFKAACKHVAENGGQFKTPLFEEADAIHVEDFQTLYVFESIRAYDLDMIEHQWSEMVPGIEEHVHIMRVGEERNDVGDWGYLEDAFNMGTSVSLTYDI